MTNYVPFALLLTLLAGLSTGIGSTIAYFIRKPKPQHMSLFLGFSAGVMLYISFAELFHAALDNIGFLATNLGFFIGTGFIGVLDIVIPHEYKQERVLGVTPIIGSKAKFDSQAGRQPTASSDSVHSSRLMRSGILIALGITIHNVPEGLAVFSSAITGNVAFGLLVAIAIAIHNIPEGISVSIPIYEATGNRHKAFIFSFAAGLAEPVGAVIGYAVLFPFLTPTLVYSLLAFAAGIMVYISLDELLPTAHMYGKEHFVIIGVTVGMLVMALSILLLR